MRRINAHPFVAPTVNSDNLASTNWTAALSLARVTKRRSEESLCDACTAEAESFTDSWSATSSFSYDWPPAAPVTVGAGAFADDVGSAVPAVPDVAEAGGITMATSELVIVDTLLIELSAGAVSGDLSFGADTLGAAPVGGAAAWVAVRSAAPAPRLDEKNIQPPMRAATVTTAPTTSGIRLRDGSGAWTSGILASSPSEEMRVRGICVVSPPIRSVGVAIRVTRVGGISFGIALTAATSARPNSLAD